MELEQWSARHTTLAFETPNVYRLMRFKDGIPAPKESTRQVKQAYLDLWGIVEYIRAQMSAGDYSAKS